METPEVVETEDPTAGTDGLKEGSLLMVRLEFWITGQMHARLRALVETGFYGRSLEEAAERLLAAHFRRRINP